MSSEGCGGSGGCLRRFSGCLGKKNYAMLGSSLEILIQSYLRGDGYTVEPITEYITLIFERSLLAVEIG